jgi:hypothetical protein
VPFVCPSSPVRFPARRVPIFVVCVRGLADRIAATWKTETSAWRRRPRIGRSARCFREELPAPALCACTPHFYVRYSTGVSSSEGGERGLRRRAGRATALMVLPQISLGSLRKCDLSGVAAMTKIGEAYR